MKGIQNLYIQSLTRLLFLKLLPFKCLRHVITMRQQIFSIIHRQRQLSTLEKFHKKSTRWNDLILLRLNYTKTVYQTDRERDCIPQLLFSDKSVNFSNAPRIACTCLLVKSTHVLFQPKPWRVNGILPTPRQDWFCAHPASRTRAATTSPGAVAKNHQVS